MSGEVVVVMPFWSQSDAMNWDSNYAYLRRVLPPLIERLPDWLWVVMWPQKSRGADTWRWEDDGLFGNPRVVRFPWPYDTAMRSSVMGFDPERFQQLEKRYAPTIYWLQQCESGLHVAGGYTQSFSVGSRPIVVAQQLYVIHRSLPYPFEQQIGRFWLQLGGSIAADRVVFNSRHALTMLRESALEYLNDTAWRAIEAKSTVLPLGMIDAETLALPITPSPRPIVVYNHRFEIYKQHDRTAAVLRELREAGHSFEVWVSQLIGQKVGAFPIDLAIGDADQRRYFQNMAVQAVNVTNSRYETFCISALDSLALGHLLVAPNGVTFPELVPSGYPYLFETPAQQRDMLAHIFSTWPKEVETWGPVLRRHVAEHFTIAHYAEAYATLLANEAAVNRDATHSKDSTEESATAFCAQLPPGLYGVEELGTKFRAVTGMGPQSCPNRRVVREIARRGGMLVARDNALHVRWGSHG
jgi:glycosyltransferase involved in cell wall biosynthesis